MLFYKQHSYKQPGWDLIGNSNNLLSKEHSSWKAVLTLPSTGTPYMDYSSPIFTRKFDPPILWFFKNLIQTRDIPYKNIN